MVYVTRNPRDACVSMMNHWKVVYGYSGDLATVVDAFLDDEGTGINTPFFHHVLGYWQRRNETNICFITYEEMKNDLASVVRRYGH